MSMGSVLVRPLEAFSDLAVRRVSDVGYAGASWKQGLPQEVGGAVSLGAREGLPQ